MYSEKVVFFFQEGIDVALLIKPVVMVSDSRTDYLQDIRVNSAPEGSPLLFDLVLVRLNVLEFVVQLYPRLLSSLGIF